MHNQNDELDGLERSSFGDSPEMANELLGYVLSGVKTATCWSVDAEGPSEVGKCVVFVDGEGRDRALVRTTHITRRRFCDVDAAFAAKEGEGDRFLAYWRAGHQNFFERNGGFSPDMELWCEEFELLKRL
jgi:uncharacterized protein YhfF